MKSPKKGRSIYVLGRPTCAIKVVGVYEPTEVLKFGHQEYLQKASSGLKSSNRYVIAGIWVT